jgi:hypothetical protein
METHLVRRACPPARPPLPDGERACPDLIGGRKAVTQLPEGRWRTNVASSPPVMAGLDPAIHSVPPSCAVVAGIGALPDQAVGAVPAVVVMAVIRGSRAR